MAKDYVILSQKPDVEISQTGVGFEDVWRITYRVTDGPAKGTVGTVNVPDSDHNAAYVNQTITDKLKDLHEIAGL